ncbi:MAG TPA: hypothetical protein DHV63_05185 [Pseudomonas sp.]|nr:hypothetical protein [Pseudomonas sp.]
MNIALRADTRLRQTLVTSAKRGERAELSVVQTRPEFMPKHFVNIDTRIIVKMALINLRYILIAPQYRQMSSMLHADYPNLVESLSPVPFKSI